MRHLQVNKIVDISASSEQASFPIENVLDTHPKRVWKSASNNAVVTIDVNYGVSDVAIFGTNAETGSIVANDPNEAGWGDSDEWGEWGDGIDIISNGTFDTNTNDWSTSGSTASVTFGVVTVFGNGGGSARLYQFPVPIVSGTSYRLTGDVLGSTVADLISYEIGRNSNRDEYGAFYSADNTTSRMDFLATSATCGISLVVGDSISGHEKEFDNISLQALANDVWANTEITTPTVSQTQRSNSEALWLELGETIDRPCVLELTLTSDGGSILKAGTIDADIATLYGGKNPQYGFSQGRSDTSVDAELSNGARYYNKRDVLRQFDLVVFMTAGNASDLLEFYETYGKLARPWKVTDEDNNDWLVYGYLIDPGSSHPIVAKSYVNVVIREEL